MKLYDSIYSPAEDTFMLHGVVGEYLEGKEKLKICEVGVGSGFILQSLREEFPKNTYFGTDINKEAIERLNDTNILEGNLLEPFKKKFDVIYFNTPYLPCEEGEKFEELTIKDRAIYGGKHGYESIISFIEQITDKLNNDGVVFILFSSLSKQNVIDKFLEDYLFIFEKVCGESHFFEKIIVYKIEKSTLLKNFSESYTKIKPFSVGKHSKVLELERDNKKFIAKVGNPQHIEKEVYFLNKLQNEEFTAEIIESKDTYVIYEKIEGLTIEEFLSKGKKEEIIEVLQKCLDICHKLDKLKIQKFEMTNPYKHIFILDDSSIKMIDYERCIFSENPKNSRQFLNYIRRNIPLLAKKDITIDENKLIRLGLDLKDKSKVLQIDKLFK